MKKHSGLFLASLVRGGLAALVLWLLLGSLDWYDPWIELKPASTVLVSSTEFLVEAGDKDTGLRDVRITITQSGEEKEVFARSFPAPKEFFGAKGSRVIKTEIPFTLDVPALGLKDGPATVVVTAHDYSWRNFFQGRTVILTREVIIKTPTAAGK